MEHTVSFDDSAVADNFARDFRVRQLLMQLSMKNVKGQQNAQDLLGEIKGLKKKTPCARLMQFLFWFLLLAVIAVAARTAWHVKKKEEKVARALASDMQS